MATNSVPRPVSLPGVITPGAGFEAPFEMLAACHERVARMLTLLERIEAHVPTHGFDAQAAGAARDVMRYFDLAAPLHHQDEELHVFPPLLAGPDAKLRAIAERLIQDHRAMEQAWAQARAVLVRVEASEPRAVRGFTAQESATLHTFAGLYQQHVLDEDQVAYPASHHVLSPDALQIMSLDMMRRRGVA